MKRTVKQFTTIIVCLVFIIFYNENIKSQDYNWNKAEISVGLGFNHLKCDIGQGLYFKKKYLTDNIYIKYRTEYDLCGSIDFRYKLYKRGYLSANMLFGVYDDYDKEVNIDRGASYKVQFLNTLISHKYYLPNLHEIFDWNIYNSKDKLKFITRFHLNIGAGVGLQLHNASVTIENTTTHDSVSEGMGFDFNIPVMFGLRYIINEDIYLEYERIGSYNFTDYLDGFSNTLYSTTNDMSGYRIFKIIYSLD